MGAWAILAFCIVAEVSATSLLTRSEGFARPVYGLLALVILGGCFWALSQVLNSNTHGCGVRDLVWGWHSADLRRWLVILSTTPHHHADPVHRVGRCGGNWPEPINQSGLVRAGGGASVRKEYGTCDGVGNVVAMSLPGTSRRI